MNHRVIHISEDEASTDFAGILARVRAGSEVVIERDKLPIAVVRPAEPYVRLLSESLRLAKQHAKEMPAEPQLDADFAADLEEIIKSREPRKNPPWE
jgi:prevent-host-death family protein